MFIIDFGSANTNHNDINYARRMISTLADIDKERKCIIKWQLFNDAPPNIPLERGVFSSAYWYAKDLGFKTTASVFDLDSLKFLLSFDIPFVKIANRRDLDWLIGEVPRKIDVIRSIGKITDHTPMTDWTDIACISKYPAKTKDYKQFGWDMLHFYGISDHTTDWTLYRKYEPEIYECHFVLEHSDTNPDGGAFARTPDDLKEIL